MAITDSDRTQVYRLRPSERCLSGTAEMALGGFFAGKTLKKSDLPTKLMAVSRCYRAEACSTKDELGLYRVHTFTKVEMFAVCLPTESDAMLERFRETQIELFSSLGLCFKVLDMPVHELGAPAYRKYDIEAWMPGRQTYGEISSCSNCTDFQARRLNIRFDDGTGQVHPHAHTANGTACAVPRMLISIFEQNQVRINVDYGSHIPTMTRLVVSERAHGDHSHGAAALPKATADLANERCARPPTVEISKIRIKSERI